MASQLCSAGQSGDRFEDDPRIDRLPHSFAAPLTRTKTFFERICRHPQQGVLGATSSLIWLGMTCPRDQGVFRGNYVGVGGAARLCVANSARDRLQIGPLRNWPSIAEPLSSKSPSRQWKFFWKVHDETLSRRRLYPYPV